MIAETIDLIDASIEAKRSLIEKIQKLPEADLKRTEIASKSEHENTEHEVVSRYY